MRGPADAGEGGEYNPQHYGPVAVNGGYVPRPAGENGIEPLFLIVNFFIFLFFIFHFSFSIFHFLEPLYTPNHSFYLIRSHLTILSSLLLLYYYASYPVCIGLTHA